MSLWLKGALAMGSADLSVVARASIAASEPEVRLPPKIGSAVLITAWGEELSAEEVYNWLQPVLRAMPTLAWSMCAFELSPDFAVTARFMDYGSAHEHVLKTHWSTQEAADFQRLVPTANNLIVITIDRYQNQVFALLDTIADWLVMTEANRCELQALRRLVGAFGVLMQGA